MPLLVTAWLAFVTFSQSPSTPPPDQKAHAAAVIAAMSANEYAKVEEQFDDKMKAALPAGRIGTIWEGLVAQLGAFKGCGADVRVRTIADKQMVISPCEFERAKLDVQLAFDTANHISGFVVRPVTPAYTPPPYANPSSYTESDVTVGSGEWALPGTLTVPA